MSGLRICTLIALVTSSLAAVWVPLGSYVANWSWNNFDTYNITLVRWHFLLNTVVYCLFYLGLAVFFAGLLLTSPRRIRPS